MMIMTMMIKLQCATKQQFSAMDGTARWIELDIVRAAVAAKLELSAL